MMWPLHVQLVSVSSPPPRGVLEHKLLGPVSLPPGVYLWWSCAMPGSGCAWPRTARQVIVWCRIRADLGKAHVVLFCMACWSCHLDKRQALNVVSSSTRTTGGHMCGQYRERTWKRENVTQKEMTRPLLAKASYSQARRRKSRQRQNSPQQNQNAEKQSCESSKVLGPHVPTVGCLSCQRHLASRAANITSETMQHESARLSGMSLAMHQPWLPCG
eukprot:177257-Amphidinium_carterae.1